jgi:DoxX-like protein
MLMSSTTVTPATSKGMLWTGRVISGLVVLFLLFDCITKIIKLPQVIEPSVKMGFTVSMVVGIGWTLLACVILYVIPRTSILGAILIVGYLGGAVATNVFVHNPAFNSAFAITFGVLTWLGIYLRDSRVRALVPFKS